MSNLTQCGIGPVAIPARAGIGLRAQHYHEIIDTRPAIGWLEIHPENYFSAGGKSLHILKQLRTDYPLSLHGVGLSMGSTDPLNGMHLNKLKDLIHRFEPALVSEHLSWGSVEGRYHNDLLPLPYTEEALNHMVDRVAQVQDHLGHQILVENVSSYLEYRESTIPEWEFLVELSKRSGCGLLLDVNNIYVNARNHGFNLESFLFGIPPTAPVQEIHLAGFSVDNIDHEQILIDTHSQPVCDAVWVLYSKAIKRFGKVPTLIEWDADLPALEVLLTEARHADLILEVYHEQAA